MINDPKELMKSPARNSMPVILICLLFILSCSGRKNKAEHRDLIPEKDLVSVLTDVYMADGLLSLPKINKLYAGIDSVTAYRQVIEQHGYTQAQLDRTVRFYFVRNPKKFLKIYDEVLARLSEMDSRIDKERDFPRPDKGNLWKGRSFYSSPPLTGSVRHEVNFQVPISGYYTLKFTLTLYPDDQLTSPSLDMYVYSADTAGNEKRFYFPSLAYMRDGLPHTYKAIVILRDPGKVLFLKGWFVKDEGLRPGINELLTVENISLSKSPIE
jgi:hypothetical protein